ncbi:MAG: bifunctional folylpolyglutamate synthase/dihydrofolate synthase [Candidatus Hydrothermia bacterium]
MEYNQALTFLFSLIDYEKKKGYVETLDEYKKFLDNFGNPHLKLKNPILIVGTKGKGSTAHLIAGGLESMGFKVGLYTSPHLIDIRERIKINGEKIPEERFSEYISRIKPFIEGKRGFRTVFETLTLIAFLYFTEENVDFAVLEAGLGGRLDATNVVNQRLTVITNISYDHMEILGNTLTKIAREKAMVIKNPNPVVVSSQHPQVYRVIEKIAQQYGAQVFHLTRNTRYAVKNSKIDELTVEYQGIGRKHIFHLNQGGIFQARNIALSALALEVMGFDNFNFENVKIEGRFEVLARNPLLIIDGAHNVDSVKKLLHSVRKLLGRDITFIFGINADKEVTKVVREIVRFKPAKVIVTKSQSPRAEMPEKIQKIFHEFGYKNTLLSDSSKSALEMALKTTDRIVAFGSFYLAGEIKELFNKG